MQAVIQSITRLVSRFYPEMATFVTCIFVHNKKRLSISNTDDQMKSRSAFDKVFQKVWGASSKFIKTQKYKSEIFADNYIYLIKRIFNTIKVKHVLNQTLLNIFHLIFFSFFVSC